MAARYFVDTLPGAQDHQLPAETLHHLRTVMRIRAGDEICLFDGRGGEATIQVRSVSRRDLEFDVVARRERSRPRIRRVELCFSPPSESRVAQILEHGCELGIASFRPLACARSKPHGRDGARLERWRRILTAAAGQSGVAWLPDLHPTLPLATVLATPSPGHDFVAERRDAWTGTSADPRRMTTGDARLFVGPEGGFTPEERAALVAAGCSAISIGPNVLRVETAALAVATLLVTRARLPDQD